MREADTPQRRRTPQRLGETACPGKARRAALSGAAPARIRKAEHVAQQLLCDIVEARLAPGSSFATEADLLLRFRVSRPTLRESLKLLESQGVLELRPGPGGGVITAQPSVSMLAHSLSVYLRLRGIPFISVLKAREVIEPALAAEAAVHGTEKDFEAMALSIARMKSLGKRGDQDRFLEENRVFHGLVARAGGNLVLVAFWSTISILASGEQHGIQYSMGNRAHVIKAHEGILRACRTRDSAAAAACMAHHLGSLENLVRERYQHLLHVPTSVVARPARKTAR